MNGAVFKLTDGCTVSVLIDLLMLTGCFALEINEIVVPRSIYAARRLTDGDQIEIIRAVGGG